MLRQISVAANQLCDNDQQDSIYFSISSSVGRHALVIMAGALFNPHCMQATAGRLLIFSIVRRGSHSCRNCPVWSKLLRMVPVQRERGKGPFTSGCPAVFACHVPYGLVIETCSKNLRVWLSIPKRSDEQSGSNYFKCLVIVLWARVLLLHGKYMVVPFKLEVACKILWCVTGTVQLPGRPDQCKGRDQT